ncbi:hypothetical protein [Bradyrhizobium sp. SZCCHNR2035]|uniref:hypothetical protein n=1 Tax=Bradyrhizobium sp. SZCCHNR2035 TaxID=3057386 RepID=UPI0029164E26|nr:hypothetical protein [Bradyrhizobium sp. SZCCHNR2035]
MAKKPTPAYDNEEVYEAVGAFIFHFSQLEFTIQARLARVLKLSDELGAIVIGAYDFVLLCTVAEQVMLKQKRLSRRKRKLIEIFFKDCRGLANPNRNIVAHALWTTGGASHVSRNSLRRQIHFSDLDDLRKLTQKAKELMMRIFRERI